MGGGRERKGRAEGGEGGVVGKEATETGFKLPIHPQIFRGRGSGGLEA